jgi:fatty acid desaturase
MKHTSDIRPLLHVVLACGLYAAALAWSLWWAPLAVFVGMYTLAIEHNHAHVPVFRRRWASAILDDVLTLTCGVPQVFWRVHHLRSHHGHAWTDEDRSSPFRFDGARDPDLPVGYRYFQLTYYPLFFATSVEAILRGRNPRLLGALLRNLLVLATASAVLVAVFGVWRWLVVMATSYAAAALMLGATNYMEHWASREDGRHRAWTFTCRVHNTLTYNSGYHRLHHQRPTLHWSMLPRVHRSDPSYTPARLVEDGLFPGYRSPAGFRRWLDRARALAAGEAQPPEVRSAR